MRKYWSFLIIMAVGLVACQNNNPNPTAEMSAKVANASTETDSFALMLDETGNPISCTDDTPCVARVGVGDKCLRGMCWNGAFCATVTVMDCCKVDEVKGIRCLSDRDCGSNEDCDDADPCTVDTCRFGLINADSGICTHNLPTYYQNLDGDLYGNNNVVQYKCLPDSGYVSRGGDCDDTDTDINPGATEVCDDMDNDCDGSIDEGLTEATSCGVGACAGNTGFKTCVAGAFVDDTCNPMAGSSAEVCDDEDNDCDGSIDEGELTCAPCNNPTELVCGVDIPGVTTSGDSYLNSYALKPLYDESGPEVAFLFNSPDGGVRIVVRPINIDPTGTDFDLFVLEEACDPSTNVFWGTKAAAFTAEAEKDYFVIVDGYNGAFGSFDLQVTCTETNCSDGVDNDGDGLTDCDDPDCPNCPV